MRTRNLIFFAVLSALIIFVPFSEYGTTCLAQDTELYPVRVNGKEGYIDATGRMVIKPQFDEVVENFSEGFAPVKIGEKWGYIDKTGSVVINPQFTDAGSFSEGLSCVRVGGKYGVGRYGFIDKTGTYVINPQYDYAASFRGGIAPVVNNDQFQYIDKKGNNIWTSTEYPSYILDEITTFDQDVSNLFILLIRLIN